MELTTPAGTSAVPPAEPESDSVEHESDAAGVTAGVAAGDTAGDIAGETAVVVKKDGNSHTSSGLTWMWETLKIFPGAVILFLLLRAFVVEAYNIPSGSMENTLQVGDFLLVNKMVYGARVPFTDYHLPALRSPGRGDVVVFEYPEDPQKNFVKRLVGLPGDTLYMTGGTLMRNGEALDESYAIHSDPDQDMPSSAFRWQRSYLVNIAIAATADGRYTPSRDNWGPIVVPDEHYFVLGDNRDNSLDSRYWGFVPAHMMIGTPLFVYFSYEPDSLVQAPLSKRIRWERVGRAVE